MAYWGISYAAGPELQPALAPLRPGRQGRPRSPPPTTRCRAPWPCAGRRQPGRAGADPRPARALSAARDRSRTSRRGTTPTPTPCARCSTPTATTSRCARVFAEAIMNQTPWKMWDLKTGGVAEGAGTAEAVDGAGERLPRHPGLVGPSGPAASLRPSDGDVAVPAARAAGGRPAARSGARCRPPDPHADPHRRAVRPLPRRRWSTTRRRSSPTASSWRARGR